MTVLFILIGIAVIGLIINLIRTVIQTVDDKVLPKWNGEYVRDPITHKCHKIYSYGRWSGKAPGMNVRSRRRYATKNKRK